MSARAAAAGHGTEDGFTLVETLVAFVIAALSVVTALEISAALSLHGRRTAQAIQAADEVEGIVWHRFAAGALRPGDETGRFSDGQLWCLRVSEVGAILGWRDVPPVWHVRLTRDGPGGPTLYETTLTSSLRG